MPPSARKLFLVLISAVVALASPAAFGADGVDADGRPERPDVSAMTPGEAEAALARYSAARKAWLKAIDEAVRREEPARKAAIKSAMERAEARKKAAQAATGASTPKPAWVVNPGDRYDWKTDAHSHGLSDAAIASLERDGLVIDGPDFPQSFSVYGDESLIPFVTSDSILNGFHVLLESTLRRYELRRAEKLRTVLEKTWSSIDQQVQLRKLDPRLVEPYKRHLALVLGPALRLLGSDVSLGDSGLAADIDQTVDQIDAANQVTLPSWMRPATPSLLAIDFRRCKPLGFYSENPILAGYYRAIRWLQMVPFRASRDVEVGAAALLAHADSVNRPGGLNAYVEDGAQIWGKETGPTVTSLAHDAADFLPALEDDRTPERAIAHVRDVIRRLGSMHGLTVNDRIRFQPHPSVEAEDDPALLILAPAILPDARFLSRLSDKRPSGSTLPNGLEVAAWLGSDFALTALQQAGETEIVQLIKARARAEDERPLWNDSVPEYYYDALRSLFATPDPAAPGFMKTEAWQRKSLQTALSGWAQLRHSWEAQAKLNVTALCLFTRPAGFVEPNPDFFRRLNKVAAVVVERMQRAGVFRDAAEDESEYLWQGVRTIDRLGLGKVEVNADDLDAMQDEERWFDLCGIAQQIDDTLPAPAALWKLHGAEQIAVWVRIRRALSTRIDALKKGERLAPLDSLLKDRDPDSLLFERWQLLLETSGQLEAMVQKQLRGADWNQDEAALLTRYKERLGEIMGYVSSATMMPKDDAPRWTTVYHHIASDRQLAVAIGRPRALYVLYPWDGKRVLCRGAVMPYYEYPATRRLTDTEWRDLLDGDPAPAQPRWIQPLTSTPVRSGQ